MRKLGVGILGVGEMGKRHAENMRRLVPEANLIAIADAYLAEVRDFVRTMLTERDPKVTGEDGLRALEIAVAAENSHLQGRPRRVSQAGAAN